MKLAERIDVAAAARERITTLQLAKQTANQLSFSEREQEMSAAIARLKCQMAERDEELAILQNDRDILREAPERKYVFIEKHQAKFSIKAMCVYFRLPVADGTYGISVVIR